MVASNFDLGDDGLSPTLNIHLVSVKDRKFRSPSPNLVFPAAKTLNAVGGNLVRPHSQLLFWDKGKEHLTPLGNALVDYAALTIHLIPDERFFVSGQLMDRGVELAEILNLVPWNEFIRRRHVDIAYSVGLATDLSPLYPGSFRWMQRLVPILAGLAATAGIAANAPQAIENTQEIYIPAIQGGLEASGEFAHMYVKGLQEILDVHIVHQAPQPPGLNWQPDFDRRRRRRRE